jgi:non-homologous end joining protein Ku
MAVFHSDQLEIDGLYNIRPYCIAPDAKVRQDAFVLIRQVIEEKKIVISR